MDGESSSLNFDYILKQNFLSVGSNTGQTSITIAQHMYVMQKLLWAVVNKWDQSIYYIFQNFYLRMVQVKGYL